MTEVRVRFAPSPTGALHIGGVRTALYNYLFAKQNKGKFILRIEDTDSTRFVLGAEQYIIDSFHWLGIHFDEGVHIDNKDGISYRQSERKEIYKQYVDYLLEKKLAYIAFDTPEEIELMRNKMPNFQYDASVRMQMNNSLTLSAEQVEQRIVAGKRYVVRILISPNEDVTVNDLIYDKVVVNSSILDDKVLWKSADGLPTYHLANVVDDHLMKITHVIRGAEWLPSAPLHILLYQYLGWEDTMPQFAHLPLILKPDGNGKLSKRDGDRLGFPVFPLQWNDPKSGETTSGYKEKGFLPEALVNFLVLLGWNPGNEQEIFSLENLIDTFSLERVNKSGAKFDFEKAKWFNHKYIQEKSSEELAQLFQPILAQHSISIEETYLTRAITLVKDRINLIPDFWEQASFFFVRPDSYDENVIKKRWKEDTPTHLTAISQIIDAVKPFDKQIAHDKTIDYITSNELNMGQIMNCLRLSIVGAAKGPDLFEIISLIGQEETAARIQKAVDIIDN